jgi:pentatricopeptide repeat protein
MPRNLAFTALRQAACARPQVLPLATTATRVGSTRQHATRFPHLLSRRSTTTSTITTEEDGFAWLRDDELEETGGTRPYLQKKTHRTKHLKQDETEDGGLDSLGTEAEVINGLYDLLRRQAGQGKIDHTQKIAEELVGKREQEPNLRIYSALIIANVHAEHGSVADIKRLLRDMSEQGLIPDAAICHNILKVRGLRHA